MTPFMDSNATDSYDQEQIVIRGGTDNTKIGNDGDKLKVAVGSLPTAAVQAWPNTLVYADMNVANGGVARGTSISTSWVDVFAYTGAGYIAGFIVNVETFTLWKFRLVVDGNDVLDTSAGITSDDLAGDTAYDVDDVTDANQAGLGLSKGAHDRFVFAAPLEIPIRYNTSVAVKVARVSGSKKFQAGIMVLSK